MDERLDVTVRSMAGRTPPVSRGRNASTTRGAASTRARKPPAKRTSAKRASARRTPLRRHSTASVIGRGIGALWMGLAHTVGWVARGGGRPGASPKESDPKHRRDGGGLPMLGLAILVGVAVWAGSAGPVGARLADAIRLFF